MGVELPLHLVVTILECCVTFSGVKLSIRSFVLFMGELYNPKEESSYLQYLDANNLYSWGMSKPLPTVRFRWVGIKPDEISKFAR